MNWELTGHIATTVVGFLTIMGLFWKLLSNFKTYISSQISIQISTLSNRMDLQFKNVENRFQGIENRLEGVENQLEELQEGQRVMNSRIDQIEIVLDAISNQVSHIGSFCDKLESDTIALDRRLIVLETKQEENSAHMHQGRISHFSQSPARRTRRGRGNPDAS